MLNVLSLACLVASVTAAQKWLGLRTTFGVNLFGRFFTLNQGQLLRPRLQILGGIKYPHVVMEVNFLATDI